jgi:signal transduction histidine kinase
MAGGLMLVALVCILVPGLILWQGIEERRVELERLESRQLETLLSRRTAELAERLEETVARVAANLRRDEDLPAEAHRPEEQGPEAPAGDRDGGGQAASLLAHTDLDLLWVVDETGTILSCGHWPARIGATEETLAEVIPGRPTYRPVRVRDQEWFALQMSEPVALGTRRLLVVGGLRLDRAVRERMGAGAEVGVALVDGSYRFLAAVPWPFPVPVLPDDVRRAVAGGERSRRIVEADDGRRHLLVTLPLVGGGRVQGSLLALRDLEPLRAWRQGLLATLATVVLVAAGLAALGGIWLGRSISRPVRELTEVTTRMAAGELDLALPVRSSDEVGRLTEAFNRMAEAVREGRRELARTERLAAWRDAARRMAHEVKNPLAPIRMSVENLKRARDVSPDAFEAHFQEECRTILEEVDALRRLVDEFSRFSRLPAPDRRPTDPAALVRHAVDLYAASLDEVQMASRIAPGLPEVVLDPGLMGQVLKNLLANALEAVPPQGGRIEVECRSEEGDILFSVRDNGPGIPAAVRERLFEPQVTTKSRGAGLGLAISRQIVEQHGGRIEVETGSEGTRFLVRLPMEGSEGRSATSWPGS